MRSLTVIALMAVLATGLAAAAQIQFSDQTVAAGLDHSPSMYMDMSAAGMFAGGSVADFNRDGWPDLFLIGGGNTADALFLNNGNGTFTDHAATWGVDAMHRGLGTTAGDFNSDGWPDLFVTSAGPVSGPNAVGMHRLYRNNGNGTFTDIASTAGVNLSSPTDFNATGSAFGDYDLDGDLDLFVCTWDGMNGNKLFRNNGDETFTDETTAAGIDQLFHGFSPRFVDMNGDRYPELLIAADFETSHYYINDTDGTFTDGTAASGTGLDENGMGTTVADFNRDGLPDWYVTSIYAAGARLGNFLYVNQGNDVFTDLPESAGAKLGGWGWGTEAVDFDHDGFIDLVETNGWNNQYENIPAFLFRNNGNLTFTEVQGGSGFDHTGQGRSVLTIDYDKDGDMDVVITAFNEPVTLFRNDLSGTDINWIQIALDTSGDPSLCPDGYGAKVTAVTNSATQYFWINGGASYLGRSQPIAHFGLGTDTSVDVTVDWANGTATTATGLTANQMATLTPSVAGAPGEASMQAAYNQTTGEIDVTFNAACDATDQTIYYGDLASVSSYAYSGAACFRGNLGVTSFNPGLSSAFFLIVGTTGFVEGTYGLDGAGFERPEHLSGTACDLPQDLSGVCD
ncbi:MAG: CRTAC1 family protein [Acidobacteriota bacterium]|nr:CRTAC1 family protein [Acidobacteriota bacterium]MDH3785143.1 CRTAC1 family protein [Acidobacteriota bacterium]